MCTMQSACGDVIKKNHFIYDLEGSMVVDTGAGVVEQYYNDNFESFVVSMSEKQKLTIFSHLWCVWK